MRGDTGGHAGLFSMTYTITTAEYADDRYVLIADAAVAVEWFRWYATKYMAEEIKRELRGKDLMCFCPLDQACHVDVLLEIANQIGEP